MHKWVAMPSPILHKSRTEKDRAAAAAAAAAVAAVDGSESAGQAAEETPEGAAETEDLAPPYVLMEHLPLAAFTNGALTALNELRHCTMLSLGRPAAG